MPQKPRIAVDARCVVGRRSGIGHYAEALLQRLVPMAPDLEFLILRHPDESGPLVDAPNVSELRFPGESKSVRTVFQLGRAHPFEGFSLYHSPVELVPLGLRCPWVVTAHDLMWIEAPRLASAFLPVQLANGLWYRANMGRALRGAKRIIAISHATEDALGRLYPEVAPRVRVVHHGLDSARYAARAEVPRSALDGTVPPGVRFSLIVGQGSPYKNHDGMVEAFVEATRDDPGHKLVLLRRFSRVDLRMKRLLARANVRERVIVLPFVPDEVLLALYQHARMLLFVSHYEGFGFPALEAMSMGLPVLASTAPAVAEVTGEGALHVPSRDAHAIAEGIRALDRDEALRARLIARGRARALDFQWERCARETLAVYREALASDA